MKRIISLVLAAAMLLCLCGCGKKETRGADEIIRETIITYGSYGDAAEDRVDALLKELKAADPEQAELWRGIIDYWGYANGEMPVYDDCLPDGLPEDDCLAIVVLGFELNPDGTMQDELLGRLNTALTCANRYPRAYVVCTGGGTAAENKDVTEAGLMGQWLLENGLDAGRLIIEDKSLTTAQNAAFSYRILRESYPRVDSVAIVSSRYHIAWGSVLFEAAFMKTAFESGGAEIHVVSNAAYPIENPKYSDIPRYQTGGMLQLVGYDNDAMAFYNNTFTKPAL